MYIQVLIPPVVLQELKHPAAPKLVRNWALHALAWLEVRTPKSSINVTHLALANEVNVEVLLLDDRAGRQEASRRGLKVAGTLSVLDEADQAG